jgi:hypothetical protein
MHREKEAGSAEEQPDQEIVVSIYGAECFKGLAATIANKL